MRWGNTELAAKHAREIGKVVEPNHECRLGDRDLRSLDQFSRSRNARSYHKVAKRNAVFFFKESTELEWTQLAKAGRGSLAKLLRVIRRNVTHRGGERRPRPPALFACRNQRRWT